MQFGGPFVLVWDNPFAGQMLAERLRELDASTPVAQGALTLPMHRAAAWIAQHISLDGFATGLFIRVFFRDVAMYLHSAERTAVRAVVAGRARGNQPDVVIAHALASLPLFGARSSLFSSQTSAPLCQFTPPLQRFPLHRSRPDRRYPRRRLPPRLPTSHPPPPPLGPLSI